MTHFLSLEEEDQEGTHRHKRIKPEEGSEMPERLDKKSSEEKRIADV